MGCVYFQGTVEVADARENVMCWEGRIVVGREGRYLCEQLQPERGARVSNCSVASFPRNSARGLSRPSTYSSIGSAVRKGGPCCVKLHSLVFSK